MFNVTYIYTVIKYNEKKGKKKMRLGRLDKEG